MSVADLAVKVFNGLFLSGLNAATSQNEINNKRINIIVSVCNTSNSIFPKVMQHMVINIPDDKDTNIIQHLDSGTQFINDAHTSGNPVLVHCEQGISRNVTLVVAYLMKYLLNGKLVDELLDMIRKMRSQAKCVWGNSVPNSSFYAQLDLYEDMGMVLDPISEPYKIDNLGKDPESVKAGNLELDPNETLICYN
ncbi:protein-tyrosine phosphatase-like protein [Jimgerdemannia flammicorona]|uniref:protein-tyrosine-phosphatase n=1 Tax=Jimgerdemannia flammicorona TaxID=994334 RepID=A0A433DM86_9FUNG|nr:protein-tyrosine phosphatase-like protein [Jimgerdemannia flammicorona]